MGRITLLGTGASAVANNYTTFNPSDKSADIALSGGDLIATASNSGYDSVRSILGMSSGKHYWEFKYTTVSSADAMCGIANSTMSLTTYCGIDANGYGNYMPTGNKLFNTGNTAYGTAQAVNDVVMVALDMDNAKIWWGKNGTWFNSGDPAAGTNAAFTGIAAGTWYACLSLTSPNVTVGSANFGATAMAYTAPSGFRQGLYS